MRTAAPFAEVSARTWGMAIGSSLGRLRPFATGASGCATTSSRKRSPCIIEALTGQSALKLDLVHPAIGSVVPRASALDGTGRADGAGNERKRNLPRIAVEEFPEPLKLGVDVPWRSGACVELRSSPRRAAPHSAEKRHNEKRAHREPPQRSERNTGPSEPFRGCRASSPHVPRSGSPRGRNEANPTRSDKTRRESRTGLRGMPACRASAADTS